MSSIISNIITSLPFFEGISLFGYKISWNSIIILVSGKFDKDTITDIQMESLALLIANLSDKYSIPLDDQHIIPKNSIVNSIAPGKNLTKEMETIIGKAEWYRWNGEEENIELYRSLLSKKEVGEISHHMLEKYYKDKRPKETIKIREL